MCICDACKEHNVQSGTPWDDPESPSAFNAFATTLFDILRSPQKFWHTIPSQAKPAPALVFALICILSGSMMHYAWLFILQPDIMSTFQEGLNIQMPDQLFKSFIFIRIIMIAPVHLLAHTFLLHFLLSGVGKQKSNLKLTGRIVGYSCGAYILYFIPPLGGLPIGQLAAFVWVYLSEYGALTHYYPNASSTRLSITALLAIYGSTILTAV